MMNKKDRERELRVEQRAAVNLEKSKLPPRMEMHEALKKERAKSEQRVDPKQELLRFGTFQPPKAKAVPNFNRLQQVFQENLDRNKQSKALVEPKPFKFDQRASKKASNKTKASIRTYVDEENNAKIVNQQRSDFNKEVMQQRPNINPRTTQKQNAYEGKRRKDLEKKMKDEMKEIEENKKRYEKQNRIKKTVQTAYNAIDNTKQKVIENKKRLEKNIQDMKKSEVSNKNRIDQIIEKGRSKELLIERFQNTNSITKKIFEEVRSMNMKKTENSKYSTSKKF